MVRFIHGIGRARFFSKRAVLVATVITIFILLVFINYRYSVISFYFYSRGQTDYFISLPTTIPFQSRESFFTNSTLFPISITIPYHEFTANRTFRMDKIVTQSWSSFPPYNHKPMHPEAALKTVKSVYVWREQEVSFVRGEIIWTANFRCNQISKEEYQRIGKIPEISKFNTIYLSVAVLTGSEIWGSNYFHSAYEKSFPVSAARSILEAVPNAKVLVDRDHFILEFLGLVLPPSRILFLNSDSIYFVERLYLPSYSGCGYGSCSLLTEFRRWVRDMNQLDWLPRKNIIIMDRIESGNCNRCLKNTRDIIDRLSLNFKDYQVIHLIAGTLSIRAQMNLLSSANILIGPHGAGLTNMIFLPDHAGIVEILNHPKELNVCFMGMAYALGLHYRGISPLRLTSTTVDFTQADVSAVIDSVKEIISTQT